MSIYGSYSSDGSREGPRRKTKRKKKTREQPEALYDTYEPCVHLHFKTEAIDRSGLTHEQYLDMLATPRGYRWMGEVGHNPAPDKKKRKKKQPEKTREDAGDFTDEFVEDMWDVMTPEVCDRLQDFLINEFNMTPEEAEDFIECKERGRKRVPQKKKSKEIVSLGPKPKWVREFSDIFAKRIEQYIVSMLLTRRTPRVKRIAEKILGNLCDLTGEKTSLQHPKTKVQRAMVLIADRLALWIDAILSDIDKPIKKTPTITEKDTTDSDTQEESPDEEHEKEHTKEKELPKGEDTKKKPKKEDEKPKKDDDDKKKESEGKKEKPEDKKEEPDDKKEKPEDKKVEPEDKKEKPVGKKEKPEDKKEEPDDKKEKPEDKKEEPEEKKENPEDKKEEPEAKKETPEEKKKEPEEKKEEPEEKKEEPEEKKEEPEEKKEEPEEKTEEPEEKKVNPEDKKEEPEEKKENPEDKKEEPEEKKEEPEEKKEEPEEKKEEPEEKKEEPEEKKEESEDKKEVPEEEKKKEPDDKKEEPQKEIKPTETKQDKEPEKVEKEDKERKESKEEDENKPIEEKEEGHEFVPEWAKDSEEDENKPKEEKEEVQEFVPEGVHIKLLETIIEEDETKEPSINEGKTLEEDEHQEKLEEDDAPADEIAPENKKHSEEIPEETAGQPAEPEHVSEISIKSKRKESDRTVSVIVRPKKKNVLDLLTEDIAQTPKDRKTDRQEAVKSVVDKRIGNMLAYAGNEGIQPEDIDDAASRVGHWVDNILGATEPAAAIPQKPPGGAFNVKRKTESTLEIQKLSSDAVLRATAQARGVDISPSARKVPSTMSPFNVKSAEEWVDWAMNITNVADEWGKWIDSKLTDAEKQVIEKNKRKPGINWKEWRDQAGDEAQKWRVEKERIKKEGDVWDHKLDKTLNNQPEVEVRSTELSTR